MTLGNIFKNTAAASLTATSILTAGVAGATLMTTSSAYAQEAGGGSSDGDCGCNDTDPDPTPDDGDNRRSAPLREPVECEMTLHANATGGATGAVRNGHESATVRVEFIDQGDFRGNLPNNTISYELSERPSLQACFTEQAGILGNYLEAQRNADVVSISAPNDGWQLNF